MANFANRFSSKKQDWTTPQELFERLDNEFCFETDLAADAINKKCEQFFDAKTNGLLQPWKGICFLNPPFSQRGLKLSDWVKKAYESSKDGSCTVVMIIPARTNTKYWR